MKALTEDGTIKRNNKTLPYFYYLEKHANPLERIAINWGRLWLERNLKNWERITMNYETNTCTVTNTVTGANRDIRITDKSFRLPKEQVLLISEESIKKWKEELLCGK